MKRISFDKKVKIHNVNFHIFKCNNFIKLTKMMETKGVANNSLKHQTTISRENHIQVCKCNNMTTLHKCLQKFQLHKNTIIIIYSNPNIKCDNRWKIF